MNTRFLFITIAVFSALLTPGPRPACAAPAALEGTVRDSNWNPIQNAIVRIEARTGDKFSTTVKTDAKGHYWADNLEFGMYRVTLVVDGKVKASINNATTKLGESRRLDFDLTGRYGARATHLVYLPEEKGSHLGGHWVDVDEHGHPNNVSAHHIETLNRFVGNGNDGFAPQVPVNPPNYMPVGVYH